MVSYDVPQAFDSGGIINCTTASTFEKTNSLKFELLFGDYLKRIPKPDAHDGVINACDYIFGSDQIFGFSYESFGVDFKRFHHAFVLRTCMPQEIGHIILGISPGAEILVSTATYAASVKLKDVLWQWQKSKIDLVKVSRQDYGHLNMLLEAKMNFSFFAKSLLL